MLTEVERYRTREEPLSALRGGIRFDDQLLMAVGTASFRLLELRFGRWIAVGDQANWERGLDSGQIWGLVPSLRHHWERMEAGDLLLMYVKAPIKSVVGAGVVRRKFRQTVPLWKEEVAEGRVIWELRFEFDVTVLLPVEHWAALGVSGRKHGLPLMAGLSPVSPEKALPVADELQRRMQLLAAGEQGSVAGRGDVSEALLDLVVSPEEVIPPGTPPPELSVHDRAQNLLYEIGQIQRLFPEREYSFAGGRLDVVWRRLLRSVPTYAFEVHISGNLESALGKLSMAHQLWNSRLFLVTEQPTVEKATYLLENAFPGIENEARVLTVDQVEHLHRRKRAYFSLEEELGLR